MISLSTRAKRGLLAAGSVLVLAGSAVGVVNAAQDPNAPTAQAGRVDRQTFLDTLAAHLNVSPDTLQQAITDTRTSLGLPEQGGGMGFGLGHRGGGGMEGRGGMRDGGGLDAAAQAIGISVDQLRQELPGKSLAQVAADHNKTANDVTSALTDAANKRIDAAVTDGRLTDEQAAQRKANEAQRIQTLVNEVMPADGMGGPGGRGMGPRGGMGGDGTGHGPKPTTSTNGQ
jgi:hypothetical protein